MASNTPYSVSDALVKCVILALNQNWGPAAYQALVQAHVQSDMVANEQAKVLLQAFFDSEGHSTWEALSRNHMKNTAFLDYVNGVADNLRPAWIPQAEKELPKIAARVIAEHEARAYLAEFDKVVELRQTCTDIKILQDATLALTHIQSTSDRGVQLLADLRADFDQMMADFQAGTPHKWIIRSGLPSLDLIIQGFVNGQVTFLVGDTGTGKSMFIQALATRMAMDLLAHERDTGEGGCIAILGGEMLPIDTYDRMVSDASGLSRQKRIDGKADWEQVGRAADFVDSLPIVVNRDIDSLTFPLLRKWCRQARNQTGKNLRAVFIDYDDLVGSEGDDSTDRANKRGEQFKRLATSPFLRNPDGTYPAIVVIKGSNRNKATVGRVHWELSDVRDGGGFAAGLMIGITDIAKMIRENHQGAVLDFIEAYNKIPHRIKLSLGMFTPGHKDYIPGLKVGFVFKNRYGAEGVFFVIVEADVTRVSDLFDGGIPELPGAPKLKQAPIPDEKWEQVLQDVSGHE